MKPLNKQFAPKSVMPEKVIQFGEGNFLRAFVDWSTVLSLLYSLLREVWLTGSMPRIVCTM